MALIDRHATSLLTAASETVWAFDKAGKSGCVCDLDAPNYEIGNLTDSIRSATHTGIPPTGSTRKPPRHPHPSRERGWISPFRPRRKGRERSERGMHGEGRGRWCRTVWVGATRGPASPPRAYPACLLRSHAPLSLGAKGAEWIPACAGMTEGGRNDGMD